MILKETKYYFENLFYELWNETPIHFAGQEFDADGIKEWINLSIEPLRETRTGVAGDTSESAFTLYVVCWSDNETNVMDIGDTITSFIDTNVDKKYITNGYNIIDKGWQDSNSVFMIMAYQFKIYNGSC